MPEGLSETGAIERSPLVRAEAIRILAEVEAGGWSDRLLQAREAALADPRERRFLHILVLNTLRWQGALDRVLAPQVHGGLARVQPRVRAALRLGVAQAVLLGRPAAIAADSTVHALRSIDGPRPAGLVNAVLRQLFSKDLPPMEESATLPAWLVRRWTRQFGEADALAIVQAVNRPARPFVVARPDRGGRDTLAAALALEGVDTRPARRHPWGLLVRRGAPQETDAFRRGDFLLLDEAAALVALLATPADDRAVADLAAAPGGKAALLAQAAPGGVVSLELVPTRLAALAEVLALRAPARRTGSILADALHPPLAREAFGLVLLDAPCSGTGTLRRRPEKRHRLKPADIADCAQRQAAMLDRAAELVGPGGALVYSVCSLEPEEGIEQVKSFLARDPRFAAADPLQWLGEAARDVVVGDPPVLATRPDLQDMDGFVAARLRRVS
ncbi:MAG: hypothetical protein KBD01_01690 [Acidobacteria bacterium]|nr:hypothetical protein [Acidobacteriota bacterium]